MIVILILSVLAACGILSVLWVFSGWLLPWQRGACLVFVCRGENPDALIRRYGWLRDMGLVRGPLILIDEGMTEQQKRILEGKHGIEICTRAQLVDRVG